MEETKESKKKGAKGIVIPIVIAIVALGVGFFGGIEYQKSKTASLAKSRMAQFQNGTKTGAITSGAGSANNTRPVSGQVTAVDNGTITVKTPDGGSKIVVLSPSTKLEVTSTGTVSDLKTGENVSIIGTTNTSGTVTAESIFIGENFLPKAGENPQANPPSQGN